MWTQNYDPLGSLWLSTAAAACPVVLLMSLLASGRVSAHKAALAALITALLLAIFLYVPKEASVVEWTPTMLAAALNGAAFGLLPIGWIVLAAIFLYNLTVQSGQFDVVKHSVAALSDDRRIQALLIAFSFGAFVEGAAGFGTPVAISAALMMGAGFRPLYAAGLALLANTSPVAFGALGTPILTLANVTNIDAHKLSAMAGRQLPIFSLVVPIWLVWVMAGWRGVVGVWPALLVCGGSFALVQFCVANFVGPELVDVAGGLISLVCLTLFLKLWQPRQTWRFADEPVSRERERPEYSLRQIASAWVPWILLTTLVLAWGIPDVKTTLGAADKLQRKAFSDGAEPIELHPTNVLIQVPALHKQIARDKPVVAKFEKEPAVYELNWLSATGTGIFFAAILSAFWLRIGAYDFVCIFGNTVRSMRWPLFTIACMLAIAYTTRYSGMDATMGLAFTHTGALYPLFAALLGWLGVALTGSDTSSNALFGSLQTITASQLAQPDGVLAHLGIEKAQLLLATANSTGGVMGKMIDAQSIVVAAVATGQHDQEGPILRFVFWHSLVLAVLMGLLVLYQAYWDAWMIP
ncbi:MAG: lactate permease LctP family transporter [Planctomycetes bacterium]|nr:lactate permease LctP family transporter [Planctomycetota bacterium]